MRIGIIGAGIAGLAAARTLRAAKCEVTLFEKLGVPGGRIATEHVGPYVFDTGATSFVPRGRPLEHTMLHELDTSQLVHVTLPLYIHAYARVTSGGALRDGTPRYTYRGGNTVLPKMLSEGLDIRFETYIEHIEKLSQERFKVLDEEFDGLILTPPVPQLKQLLASVNEGRAFSNVRYRACISVCLGYDKPLGNLPYHALVDPENIHPVMWLSIDSLKSPNRAPEGHTAIVAQLGPVYSADRLDASDQIILEEALAYIIRLYGKNFATPAASHITRWIHSQPESTALFENVNRASYRVLIAGDGIIGGRTELAYETGVRAAKQLYSTLSNQEYPPVDLKVL